MDTKVPFCGILFYLLQVVHTKAPQILHKECSLLFDKTISSLFSFPQSYLGYLTLVLCTAHTLLYGSKRFLNVGTYPWFLPAVYMLSLIIPCIVLVMKFVLVFPCLDRPLTAIRQGWERKPKSFNNLCGSSV